MLLGVHILEFAGSFLQMKEYYVNSVSLWLGDWLVISFLFFMDKIFAHCHILALRRIIFSVGVG